MRISEWSSDVCSSDLLLGIAATRRGGRHAALVHDIQSGLAGGLGMVRNGLLLRVMRFRSEERRSGQSVSVRVDIVGRRIITKKTQAITNKHIDTWTENYLDTGVEQRQELTKDK